MYLVLNGLKTSSNTYGDEILTIARNRGAAPAATWEDEENIKYHTDESWHSEAEQFFSAIKSNSKVKIGISSDALKLMKIIDEIYSFRKGKIKMDNLTFIKDYLNRYKNRFLKQMFLKI